MAPKRSDNIILIDVHFLSARIDRTGAREYIRQRSLIHTKGWRDLRRRGKAFTRFCTVDIGLTSYTLGVGRNVIDRLPNAKHDLVLLRLRNGDDLLLSPQYNQDLVDSLSRRLSDLHKRLNSRTETQFFSRSESWVTWVCAIL